MNSAFNNQILAEKLRKLNNSQQSIETLSHWCIFHRKKARLVVETWDTQVRDLTKEQQIPLLYLANDILQNSRRRGGEFVAEFWKILPGALKDVMEKGDERIHTVVFRLVDIWDERKVFGSRARTLREELLGDDPPTDLPEQQVKPSHTIRIKVPLGGILEKLTSAYRSVSDVAPDEDAVLGRCNAAVNRIDGLEKESSTSKKSWEAQNVTIVKELQEQQNILTHCVEQLEMSELARAALISHLKEALREQESKLDLIRTQLQTARAQAKRSGELRQQLLTNNRSSDIPKADHGNKDSGTVPDSHGGSHNTQSPVGGSLSWPAVPFVETISSIPEETKATKSAASVAAEVAAKLAASASSAQMLTSVLSSFVSEEASTSHSLLADEAPPGTFIPDKRQRLNGQNEHIQNAEGSPSNPIHSAPMPHQQSMGLLHAPATQQLQQEHHHQQQQQHQPPPQYHHQQQQHHHHHQPQHTSNTSANMQGQLSPALPPTLLPRPQQTPAPPQQYMGQAQNVPRSSFGYGMPPPMPPMQRQVVTGIPSTPMQPQNPNPNQGPFQAIQPPVGYYSQLPLPTHQRQ